MSYKIYEVDFTLVPLSINLSFLLFLGKPLDLKLTPFGNANSSHLSAYLEFRNQPLYAKADTFTIAHNGHNGLMFVSAMDMRSVAVDRRTEQFAGS